MSFSSLALLIVGFLFLALGSNLLIKGALAIAKRLGWTETFVGLTLVSFCVNLPEIMITISGMIKQLQGEEVAELVMGNIVGSSMGQIGLVLGIAGLFQVIKVKKSEIISNGLMLIASTLLLFILAIDGRLAQSEGVILLVFLGLYLLALYKMRSTAVSKVIPHKFVFKENLRSLAELLMGLIVIVLGSELVVDHSLELAKALNINQLLIGLFVVGIGVSLPELFVAISALVKGSAALSVGSMLGGNIILILLGLGGTSLVGDWNIPRSVATFDMAYLLLTTVIVVLFLLTKKKLERKESFLILAVYGIFAVLKALGF